MPPSARAVDRWLTAYAEDDGDTMAAYTAVDDRDLVRSALHALREAPTSTLALALPPRPVAHEVIEIENKAPGRHTVLTLVTMKNPLAFSAERVGQTLDDVPRTRRAQRRFLSIESDSSWGVKLDLHAALIRIEYAVRFEAALSRGDFVAAQSMLSSIPPPPDEANAIRHKDRLEENLRHRLQGARSIRARSPSTTGALP